MKTIFSTIDNLRSAAITVAAYGCFAVNDALMKLVMLDLPQLQAIFFRGLIVVPLLALLATCRGELIGHISNVDRWMLVGRMLGDVATTFAVLGAIHSGPMADVAVILGAQPLCVMIGAAVCLGERIDRASWAMGFIGLLGVVLVARPNARMGLSPHAVLAMLGNVFGVARDLLARRISDAVPATQIATFSAVAVTTASGLLGACADGWADPAPREVGLLAVSSTLLAIAQVGGVLQMRLGDVGFVQPFRYSYIVWCMLLGILVFQQFPDGWTLAGAAVVAGCGIAALVCERRRSLLAPKGACRLKEESTDIEVPPTKEDAVPTL